MIRYSTFGEESFLGLFLSPKWALINASLYYLEPSLVAECRYAAQSWFHNPLTGYNTSVNLLRKSWVGSTWLVKTLFRPFPHFHTIYS